MNPNSLEMPESFAKLLFATQSHMGGADVTKTMKEYIYGARGDKITVFDIKKMWEKYVLAARAICGLQYADDITVISCKTFGRKPVMKFAESTGAKPYTGRFIPGSFTNTSIKKSCEPRLIIVSDPILDEQAIEEAAKINCPTIAFCNTDSDLKYVDIAIPMNNRSPRAIGVGFFILKRIVRYIQQGKNMEENIKEVELFFYRDTFELEQLQEEQNEAKNADLASQMKETHDEIDFGKQSVESNSWQ
ncbi:40S ribosomal protein S0 [Nucleospora cyclopteri]